MGVGVPEMQVSLCSCSYFDGQLMRAPHRAPTPARHVLAPRSTTPASRSVALLAPAIALCFFFSLSYYFLVVSLGSEF